MALEHPATFQITAEDYAAALRLHAWRYLVSRRLPKLFALIVVLGSVAAMVVSGFDERYTSMAIGGLIGLAVLPPLAYFVFIPMRARKVFRQQKTLHMPVTVTWTDEGYTATAGQHGGTIAWTDYYGWSADATMIILMQSDALFQMLPKRVLSPADLTDFEQTVTRSGLRRI